MKAEKKAKDIEKQKVLKQMEEDRQRRKDKFAPSHTETPQTTTSVPTTTPQSDAVVQCTLQMRLPGGQAVRGTFQSNQTLRDVHRYITSNHTSDPSFVIIVPGFPKKEYKDKQLDITLKAADLSPMGSITIQMITEKGVIHKYEEPISDEQVDTDAMSYEQLLDLEDKIGTVPPAKVTKETLPTKTYHASANTENAQPTCLICMAEFEEEDTLKILPCNHEFHKDCIDQWFNNHNKCPLCKQEV